MMQVSLFVHAPNVLNNFRSVIAAERRLNKLQKFLFDFEVFETILGVPERIIDPLGQSLPVSKIDMNDVGNRAGVDCA